MRPEGTEVVACRVVEADHPGGAGVPVRGVAAGRPPTCSAGTWTGPAARWWSRPGPADLAGVALGETVAGMARLHDLLVTEPHQGRGLGGRLVELFCARAAELGAGRCFLRCPDTDRHRRFYERLGFVAVALLPATTTTTTSSSTCASPCFRGIAGPGRRTPGG